MVQFNCNNGKLFPSYRLPIQSKKGYESLCEVMYEYLGNNACLMNEISQKIRDNTNLYENYSKSDHSDIGPHYKTFPSIDLGDGYTVHIGMNWPERKENLLLSLTKDFVLGNGDDNITFGMIYPDKPEERVPAFLTESFFESFSRSTKFGKVFSSLSPVKRDISHNSPQEKPDGCFRKGSLWVIGTVISTYSMNLPTGLNFRRKN